MVGIGHDGGALDLLEATVRPAVGDIALYGIREQEHVLHGHADVVPQIVQVHFPNICSAYQHLAGAGVVEPAEQVHQGGLAGAGGADDAHGLAGRHPKVDILHKLFVVVGGFVGHVLELHLAAQLLVGIAEGVGMVPGEAGRPHFRLLHVGGINLLHGGIEVLDVVDPPGRHSQRRVQHPQVAVDLHQVPQRDFPLDDQVSAVEL